MARILELIIPEEFAGAAVYYFLKEHVRLSTRIIRSIKFKENGIRLNGERARTSTILCAGDHLVLTLDDAPGESAPTPMALDILYEDEDLLVVNKPAGLAMHPSHNHPEGTLINGVIAYQLAHGRAPEVHAVGRLDKNTSGVSVCALNRYAASRLNGRAEKEYLAIAEGTYTGRGVIDAPIIRPDPMKTLRAVGAGGLRAVTRWESLGTGHGLSLLRIRLETGRTHQIRVHFAAQGAPLAGDDMYGGSRERIDRHALHCARVALAHPVTGKNMVFRAPMPEDMQRIVERYIEIV